MNWTKVYAYGGAGVVGAVAAVVSFGHLRALALSAGESPLAAALLPISVDGLLVSAAGVMLLDGKAGSRARTSARVAFAVGCVATLVGNVASARPTVTGWLVAAWAPLALLLVTEMLARRSRPTRPAAASRDTRRVSAGIGKNRSTGERVAAARHRHPDATQGEIARRTRLGVRTVARHWHATGPDTTPAPNSHHGRQPVLTGSPAPGPTT